MDENELAMSCGVEAFLQAVGLHDYTSTFVTRGYDREADLRYLCEEDLDNMLISEPSHRRVLLTSVRTHTLSEEGTLLEWLREYSLEHYFIGFVRSQLVDIEEVGRLELPDDNIYDELEISMPGHRRRLERAVKQLRKRQKVGENAEVPVAEGYWGKPHNLEDAKYDFLCVEAVIASTRDASRKHTIDFMVDSGSDVTTLQEDLLYTLNPELIGPINSKGVHSSMRKNLYKAKLSIGSQDLEIEVMGESYNSLGSRVLRNFRHYITGSKHIWLSGDYFDPMMSSSLMMAGKLEKPTENDKHIIETVNTEQTGASTANLTSGDESATLQNYGNVNIHEPSETGLVKIDIDNSHITDNDNCREPPKEGVSGGDICEFYVETNPCNTGENNESNDEHNTGENIVLHDEHDPCNTGENIVSNYEHNTGEDIVLHDEHDPCNTGENIVSNDEHDPCNTGENIVLHDEHDPCNTGENIVLHDEHNDNVSRDYMSEFVVESNPCNTGENTNSKCEYTISKCDHNNDNVDGKVTVQNGAAYLLVEAKDGDCS